MTGATLANFTALAAARHAVLARAGWNVEADGLFGAPPITVVIGDEAHPTLLKSLGLLGLGRNRLLRVPTDGQGRMSAKDLPALRGPAIVCMQAGNINTGAFDPFDEVIPLAHEAGAWVHVDGAFGLWALGVPSLRRLATGMETPDSWATDAHKWLNVPYDSGLAFVRDAGRAARGHGHHRRVPADGRRAPQPVRFHAGAVAPRARRRGLGRDALAGAQRARRDVRAQLPAGAPLRRGAVRRGLRDPERRRAEPGAGVLRPARGHRAGHPGPAGRRHVLVRLQPLAGPAAMRISVCSWATTDADVERSIDAMLRVAARQRGG